MKRNRSYTYSAGNPIYFITTTVTEKLPIFLDEYLCRIILDNLSFYRDKMHFAIYAYVIMPTHIHLLVQQLGSRNISEFMKGVKEYSSKQILKYLENMVGSGDPTLTVPEYLDITTYLKTTPLNVTVRSPDLTASQLLKKFKESAIKYKQKGTYQVWQERFDDVLIWSEKQFNTKLDYIHDNPTQEHWNLVDEPQNYKYSSARNYELDDESIFKIDIID